MLAYHFLEKKWALEDIRRRRLRISNLEFLNDPFEFMSFALTDHSMRRRVNETKRALAKSFGLVCFSKRWSNPVLWSHYAERHAGICLGFDIPSETLKEITYVVKRTTPKLLEIIDDANDDDENAEKVMQKLLYTKYHHWRYESEVRLFLSLDPQTVDQNGNYFAEFSDKLQLRQVIVGAVSDTTRTEVTEAVAGLTGVEAFKTRLAFASFSVVRNRNQHLWT